MLPSETPIDGLLFYSTSVKNSITIAAEGIAESTGDNAYSMKMSFGFKDTDDNEFQDQDLLITWQLRIATATQSSAEGTQN